MNYADLEREYRERTENREEKQSSRGHQLALTLLRWKTRAQLALAHIRRLFWGLLHALLTRIRRTE